LKFKKKHTPYPKYDYFILGYLTTIDPKWDLKRKKRKKRLVD